MKRDKRVILTMSMEEWETIKRAADADSRTVSAFMRLAALERAKEKAAA
jgi:uncharacterized protein (DUF1778 family)